jgi:hypothetical protein
MACQVIGPDDAVDPERGQALAAELHIPCCLYMYRTDPLRQ